MKALTFLYVAILASSISISIRADEPKAYVAEITETSETFRSRILKVHRFVEGDLEYTAYTINWRGHEVLVPAGLTDQILKEGHEIRCLMSSKPFKVGGDKKASIGFSIISSRPDADDNEARLRENAAEVKRRRDMRR
ncbi:MAG TPA: hypothetical protein VK985_05350 [Rariglobus sp.]|nr:hypothetical protein [Rariglobus sp.]